MTTAELLTAVSGLVTDNPIIMAVVGAGAVFALLRLFIRAVRAAAR